MKYSTIALAAAVSVALSAGTAFAQMQPIPNPPEKPMAATHHKKHHSKKHHAKKAAAKADAKADAAKAEAPKADAKK